MFIWLSENSSSVHKHTHTHPHPHTPIHKLTHTHKHTQANTRSPTHTHTHTYTHTHTHVYWYFVPVGDLDYAISLLPHTIFLCPKLYHFKAHFPEFFLIVNQCPSYLWLVWHDCFLPSAKDTRRLSFFNYSSQMLHTHANPHLAPSKLQTESFVMIACYISSFGLWLENTWKTCIRIKLASDFLLTLP